MHFIDSATRRNAEQDTAVIPSHTAKRYLPDAAADCLLRDTGRGELTFVEYLRLSFEWAGFPGLRDCRDRDEEILASLTEGLLPL